MRRATRRPQRLNGLIEVFLHGPCERCGVGRSTACATARKPSKSLEGAPPVKSRLDHVHPKMLELFGDFTALFHYGCKAMPGDCSPYTQRRIEDLDPASELEPLPHAERVRGAAPLVSSGRHLCALQARGRVLPRGIAMIVLTSARANGAGGAATRKKTCLRGADIFPIARAILRCQMGPLLTGWCVFAHIKPEKALRHCFREAQSRWLRWLACRAPRGSIFFFLRSKVFAHCHALVGGSKPSRLATWGRNTVRSRCDNPVLAAKSRTYSDRSGLYDPAHGHDACGVAFVARLDGQGPPGKTVRRALRAQNLEHRGASGADADSATAPESWSAARRSSSVGRRVPPPGRYGVGAFFLPSTSRAGPSSKRWLKGRSATGSGSSVGATSRSRLSRAGTVAAGVAPTIRQAVIGAMTSWIKAFERKLYVIRRVAELAAGPDLVVPSLLADLVYLARMLTAPQLERFYLDLADERVASTRPRPLPLLRNTFPSWELAPSVPGDRAQRRDQHAPRQHQLDARARVQLASGSSATIFQKVCR